jgi:hypothetical protein
MDPQSVAVPDAAVLSERPWFFSEHVDDGEPTTNVRKAKR